MYNVDISSIVKSRSHTEMNVLQTDKQKQQGNTDLASK
jgi:hypothetical protein